MNDALKIAFEEFRKIPFENIPQRCDVSLEEDKIKIEYLNRWYAVSRDDVVYLTAGEGGRTGVDPDGNAQVSERDKTIILHYLVLSKGASPSGKLIDFREVPGGRMYYEVFQKRVYDPFLEVFGEAPVLFVEVATSMGGERVSYGDIAFKFALLPRVPVNFILHTADEDFPPACKLLFDSNISDHMPTEDIAIVCEEAVKWLRAGTKKG